MLVRTSCVSFAYPQRAGEKLIHYTVLPLHKKARKAHLFSCKRLLDGSHLLPPFCGGRAYWETDSYYSAMQGLNTSEYACVDMQGGAQFAYFQQFNASGGGSAVMNTCKQEAVWTRSPVYYYADCANVFNNAGGILHTDITASFALHPAGDTAWCGIIGS